MVGQRESASQPSGSDPEVPALLCRRVNMGIAALILGFFVLVLGSSPVHSGPWKPDHTGASLRQLRLRAISDLQKIPANDRQVQETIREAIEDITESISRHGQEHFLTEAQILSAPHGKRVFQNSKQACSACSRGSEIRRSETPERPSTNRLLTCCSAPTHRSRNAAS